jgi:hypothetical protein
MNTIIAIGVIDRMSSPMRLVPIFAETPACSQTLLEVYWLKSPTDEQRAALLPMLVHPAVEHWIGGVQSGT